MLNRIGLFLPLISLGCSTTLFVADEDGLRHGDVVLQRATVLLDTHPGVTEIQVGTDQIALTTDGTVDDLRIGSVVVGQRGGGYLRRVTEIVHQGQRIVLRTEPAELADAVRDAKVNATVRLDELRAATTWDLGGRVLLDETLWSNAEGGLVHASVFIADGAHLTIDPTFDFDLELFNGNWVDARFSSNVTLDYEADFVAAVTGRYDDAIEQPVLSRSIPFVFEMGPVPVVGTAHVTIVAGVEGAFDGAGTTTLHTEAHAWASASAGYTDGWWGWADGDFSGDLGFQDTELGHTSRARVYLRAELELELYGSAGAQLDLEPWVEADSCGLTGVDVDGGLTGEHAYHFRAFGWDMFSWGPYGFDAGTWDLWEMECAAG